MLSTSRVRALALGLPGATEDDHHGRPSFRVRGKIFGTLWDDTTLNVMAPDELIRAAVSTSPDCCALRYWGTRLAAVQIDLERAGEELVRDLLQAAWDARS